MVSRLRERGAHVVADPRRVAAGVLAAAAAAGAVTGVVYLLRAHVPVLSLGVLYVLAVSAVAVFFGRALAVSVSLASVLLFNDDETGQADWIGLAAGTFRRRHLLVPAAGAELDGVSLKVPWPKQRIEDAPTYGESDHRGVLGLSDYRTAISEEKERLASAHYGLGE